MVKLFEGTIRNWKFVLIFVFVSVLFWLTEFFYQFYFISFTSFNYALIRSFAFSGATFIALSLLSSSVFKFKPALLKYWTVRRSLGVTGTLFGLIHFLLVLNIIFNFDISLIFYSFNPFFNPLIFGYFSLGILVLLSLISTDFAVAKLGVNWKKIQRLVYFSFWALIGHFLLVNPFALMNLAGYFLLIVSFFALTGELYWFIIERKKKNFSGLGALIGYFLILLYFVLAYFVYLKYLI